MSQASIVHEPSFIAFDLGFEAVVGRAGWIAHVCAVDAHEGPVYAADEHALYFTTVPRPGRSAPVVDIKRLDLESNEVMGSGREDSVIVELPEPCPGLEGGIRRSQAILRAQCQARRLTGRLCPTRPVGPRDGGGLTQILPVVV